MKWLRNAQMVLLSRFLVYMNSVRGTRSQPAATATSQAGNATMEHYSQTIVHAKIVKDCFTVFGLQEKLSGGLTRDF